MSSSSSVRSAVADWDRLPFVGLLAGVVLLGLAVQVVSLVRTTTWTTQLQRVVLLVPVVVGLLTYVRNRPVASAGELAAVTAWGVLAQWIADVAWFIAGGALVNEFSVSAVLLSGAAELRLAELLRFLGAVAVFAGFYTVAASRRDRLLVSAGTLLVVPVVLVLVYAVV